MRLDDESLSRPAEWKAAGYEIPRYDRRDISKRTYESPEWVHFGAGNIFRAFPAALQQALLDKNLAQTGIIVAEGFDTEILEKVNRPFDNLSLLVTLRSDGTIRKSIIGSVVESLAAVPKTPDWDRLLSIFRSPSLRMASFTITEKGYSLPSEISDGPDSAKTIMEHVAALCHARYRAGSLPLALVSMDNCSHNGTRFHDAVCAIAEKWEDSGTVDKGFTDYLGNPKHVSFPWSMIDKITPRPDESVKAMLERDGYESAGIIVTEKKTYTASFVNAEETEYLIIEEAFPNGRPPLEKAGVLFTDRDTVDRVEKMKVCTCLNPLHTSLAIFGCLLSYKSIHREMADPLLKKFVEKIGYAEGLPVVVDPGIIDPNEFIRVVIEKRFPNPFMPDTPQRIATDSSQKIPVRFGETLKAYVASSSLDVKTLVYIPLVFAGWCRYLMGIDDFGNDFEPSPDPLLEELRPHVRGISLGDRGLFHTQLKPLLSDASIFGMDLYAIGLADRVESCFSELVSGPGAVRKTLQKYLES